MPRIARRTKQSTVMGEFAFLGRKSGTKKRDGSDIDKMGSFR